MSLFDKNDSARPALNLYGAGVNPARQRDHNERLVLSVVKSEPGIASSQIARKTGLSAQAASVLTRSLVTDGLLERGEPIKGKVGKPRHPMSLNPKGAFAYGLRIGRRWADLILVDFNGTIQNSLTLNYAYPSPSKIDAFVKTGIAELIQNIPLEQRDRITGIGVAAPFELWNWLDTVDAPSDEMSAWKDHSFAKSFATFSDLHTYVANDATLACSAELTFGQGVGIPHFAYFYIGAFVGGGLTLNNKVLLGPNDNAGAFGSIPVGNVSEPNHQLIHNASLYVLENALREATGNKTFRLTQDDDIWSADNPLVTSWIKHTAQALAKASVSIVATLDVPTIILDGGFPNHIRETMVTELDDAIQSIDTRGMLRPKIIAGKLGRNGAALGAAYLPISSQFLI